MKAVFRWMGVKLMAPGVALVVVAIAIVLVAMGVKELQIGGLLGWLFGKKDPEQKAIDIANTVPPHRVDPNGVLIPQGTPDSKGDTQAVVVPIQSPGIFSNPTTVTFTPPGSDKPIEIQLPDGIKNKDVDKVIVVQPGKFVVTVKDSSGIPAQKVDDLLKKYGG
jgi:hypothetical protein